MKVGTGPNTGVELRYHKGNAYNNLSREEKSELREWREPLGSDGKVPGDPNHGKRNGFSKGPKKGRDKGAGKKVTWGDNKIKSQVASLTKKEADKARKNQVKEDKELKEVAAWVSEVVAAASPAPAAATTSKTDGGQSKAMVAVLKLNAILKRRSNNP